MKNNKLALLLVLLVFGLLLSLGKTSASRETVKEKVSNSSINANALNFVSCDMPGFAPPVSFPANAPAHSAVGDFNLDGRLDIVTPSFSGNVVSVLLGDGLGNFSSLGDFPVGVTPIYVAVADLSFDGLPDIVSVNGDSNNISILVNDGNGGFFLDQTASVGIDPFSVAIGDFNRNGDKELAVANFSNNNVTILSNVDGYLTVNTITVGSQPFAIATADLNKDGILDLAVTNQGDGTVSILIGDGDNGFTSVGAVTVGTAPESVQIADINHDGNLDLAVANLGSNNISVLLGNGTGGFTNQPGSPFAVATGPQTVTVADFNGDGRLDLASSTSGSDISVLLATATGFAPNIIFPAGVTNSTTGFLFASVVAGDFTLDGKPDIVATGQVSNNISLLPNTFSSLCITPSFAAATNFATGTTPLGNAVGDINLDGRQDVIVLNSGSNNLSVFLGTGTGGFTAGPTVSSGGFNPDSAAIADFNRDGNPDLAITNRFSDALAILSGDGTGNFTLAGSFPTGGINPSSLSIADFNIDGNPDVVTGNVNGGGSISIFFGNGTTVDPPSQGAISVGQSPSVVTGDFDRDGNPDIVVAVGGLNTINTFFGDGFGGFFATDTISSGGVMPFVQDVGDFNNDGILDILITNFTSGTGNVFLGDGAGGFIPARKQANRKQTNRKQIERKQPDKVPSQSFNAGLSIPTAQRLRFADFNHDGKLDIFAATDVGTNLRILLGDGFGGVLDTVTLPFIFGNSFTLALADFNRDGRLDLGSIGGGFAVRLSNCIGAPNSIVITGGFGQSTVINRDFATPLQATVFDPKGIRISGVLVQFDTPTAFTSAGATFPGGEGGPSTTATAITNATGLAVAPTLTANAFTGSYMAIASVVNDSGVVICTNPGFTLTNICPTITLSPVGLPTGTINVPYNQTITASGGTDPYTFSIGSRTSLPPGLFLDSSGVISGTPTMLGTFNFDIVATDSNGCTGVQSYSLTISCAVITFTPSTLPAGLVGAVYNQTISVNVSISNLSVMGTLPPGLTATLVSDGKTANMIQIQGTPTTSGTFNFTLQITDGNGCIGTQAYALVINCATITVSPSSLPNGQGGVAYSQALTASGGSAPYVFSLASGTLPPGLTVLPTGGLTGTPNTAGTFNFTIQARDRNSCIGSRSYTISISGNAGSISFSAGSFTVTEGGTATITVNRTGGSNGTVSVNYGTNNGSAIAGTNYNSASGSLNFTNGDASPKSFTIQTIANNSFEANKTLTISLFGVTGGATLGVSSVTLTILERDTAQPGRVAFSQPSYTVNEAGGVATIVVNRTNGNNVPISVNFSTSPGANAQAGINYFETTGTLTFAPNINSQSFNIPIINDRQPGQNKTVNLLLLGATNGAVIAGGTATLTIIESTPPVNPPLLQVDARVEFGPVNIGDTVKRTVTLRNGGGQDLIFTPPIISGDGISLTTPPSITRLAPNQTTNFEVSLKPAPGSLGSVTGTIIVNSNGGNITIPVTGQSIDNVPPKVMFSNLAGGDILTAGSAFRIRYDATDNDALNDFTVSFTAAQNTINPQTGASGGDIARADSTAREIVWNIPADLETSNARVIITGRDRAGNLVSISSGQFSIRRSSDRAPILQTLVSFTPPTTGQIDPPTNVTANATEIRDSVLTQPPQPVLLVQVTFDPPPANQLLPPQNVRVKAAELSLGNIAFVNRPVRISPKADGLTIAGYNVYRVPQPTDGTLPTPEQIVNPANLVTTLPSNSTGFNDKVSTTGSNNYVYSVSTFFGNGQMSGGSAPMGTNLPVIKNPVFAQGTILLDFAATFIKQGAVLIVNDTETYPLQFDNTGTRLTVSKKQPSSGSGVTIKRLISKTAVVKLVIRNTDGTTSVAVMFGRGGIVKTIANTANLEIGIEPKADPPMIAGYNIYRVAQPTDGTIPKIEDIVKPENLVGSVSGTMTSFMDKPSTSSSNNFVYSVSTFFGNGQMSGGSQPATTDLPVVINPKFDDKNFFVDSAASFIKLGATLIINDTEVYNLEFDDTGTRFTTRKNKGTPSDQTIDKFIKKGDTVRLTIKNPDGKLSVGVMFTRK